MIKNAKVVGEFSFPQMKKLIIIGAIVLVALVVFAASITIVPAGHTGVIVTLGKVSNNVLSEGFHLKAPLVQNVVKMRVSRKKQRKFDIFGGNWCCSWG